MRQDNKDANYGIIATNVSANVLAVGTAASAVQNVQQFGPQIQAEAQQLLSQFRTELERVLNDPERRAFVEEETKQLEKTLKEDAPSVDKISGLLESISKKLRLVGVVVANVQALAAPLGALAKMLRVPLHVLGL